MLKLTIATSTVLVLAAIPAVILFGAAAFARWMGHDPRVLRTTTLAMAGMVRPGNVVLDSSLAATHKIRCRSLAEALPFAFSA